MSTKLPQYARWSVLLVAFVLVAWTLRAPFLHREIWNVDEGATFTMAEQILDGQVLYRDAVDHRSPLVAYLAAAVFAIAGHWNMYAQHLVLALSLGACAFGLFILCERLGHRAAGIWSGISFTVVSLLLAGAEDGLALHTEWFVVIFSTLGFCLFASTLARRTFVAGLPVGIAFGAATLCKQPGLLDFAVTWVILALLSWREPAERRNYLRLFAGMLAGFAALFAVVCVYFWAHGGWKDFVYYCWTYNTRVYVPEVPPAERLAMVRLTGFLAVSNAPVVVALGVPGLLLVLGDAVPALLNRARKLPLLSLLVLGWTCSGLVSTMLSGRGFSHYVIQVIPGLSLACGWFLARLGVALSASDTRRIASGWIGCALAVWTVFQIHEFRARVIPMDDIKQVPLRRLVQRYTVPSDRIVVWGYFPDAHVITRRLPATRFIYSNFLTGLIPWTNIAPDRDTSYAVVPGAWDAFWEDFTASQPRVIINSYARFYTKYPLLAQSRMRDVVIDEFVELQPTQMNSNDGKVLLRVSPIDPTAASETAGIDPALSLSARGEPGHSDVISVTVTAPAGTSDLTLRLGRRPYRHVRIKPDAPAEVRFMIRIADVAEKGAGLVDVVAARSAGLVASKPLDVVKQLVLDVRPVEPAPVLLHSTRLIDATSGPQREGWSPQTLGTLPGWRHTGPFSLTFPRPSGVDLIRFNWQSGEQRSAAPTEEIQAEPRSPDVFFTPDRTDVRTVVATENSQSTYGTTELTARLPDGNGTVTIQWKEDRPLWLGNISGYASGPLLRFGDTKVPPANAVQNGDHALTASSGGSWDAAAPARIVYPRKPGMEGVVLQYGIRENAYAPVPAGGSGRVIVQVNFLNEGGAAETIFSRSLEPETRPGDRGLQTAHVNLPSQGLGEIEIKIVPLEPVSPNNRTFLESVRASGPGPDLVISPEQILVPIESQLLGGDRVHTYSGSGWFAHAPSKVVYEVPADLKAITFGFELPKSGYLDDQGKPRSDGVGAVVEFEDEKRNVTQLYHRDIDPSLVPSDRGVIKARVELPGKRGRLTIRLTPGPHNVASFDWAYLTEIRGETISPTTSP